MGTTTIVVGAADAAAGGVFGVNAVGAGGRALVPAGNAIYATATERLVAGYNVLGNCRSRWFGEGLKALIGALNEDTVILSGGL
jgi:hypothetical protein